MSRKFTFDAWDFDCDGSAYIIAKDECPNREDVPDFICREDGIHSECKQDMVVEEGWCKYQVRTDWEDYEGERMGGYIVEKRKNQPCYLNGKKLRGWFPVWIVRKYEWY